MVSQLTRSAFLIAIILAGVFVCVAQDASIDVPARDGSKKDEPKGVTEMLAKLRLEREKKDYEEMLKRGDEALMLSQQLETSFEQNKTISSKDRQKLDALEKAVIKIRKELGGGDDDGDDTDTDKAGKPSDVREAFKDLQTRTVKLVDALKKTTRFSISAAAIQSSNSVLKLVRLLRLRKF